MKHIVTAPPGWYCNSTFELEPGDLEEGEEPRVNGLMPEYWMPVLMLQYDDETEEITPITPYGRDESEYIAFKGPTGYYYLTVAWEGEIYRTAEEIETKWNENIRFSHKHPAA